MNDTITFAVGDVHGCHDRLRRLLELCADYAADRPYRLVMLGDYIDRGPDSAGVVGYLRALQSAAAHEIICLRGNHEDLMLRAVDDDEDAPLWLHNGGEATLDSYGVHEPAGIPAGDVAWVRGLPLSFDDGQRFFVHAGVDPTRRLDQQREHDLMWMRAPFNSGDFDCGRFIVHGHTPTRDRRPDLRLHRLNLDTGAVMGGPLSAAVFGAGRSAPLALLNDAGEVTAASDEAGAT